MADDQHGSEAQGGALEVVGTIKWFDPIKGFGFVVPDLGGPDILLHINVLRGFGQSSIVEGARVELLARHNARGIQAVELISVAAPQNTADFALPDLEDMDPLLVAAAPFAPARVKWFDKAKGFGFANAFGRPEDIFLHVEVLRRSGLSLLQPGEALALKVIDGKRGKMAAEVQAWETIRTDHDDA